MERIAIIGCGGAGKSTLARELGHALALPVHHLDCMFWKPGWKEVDRTAFVLEQQTVIATPRWIIDGNYGVGRDLRFARADTVIFMDLPTLTCLWSIVARYFRYRHQSRPAMTEGNRERLSFDFLRWIWSYRKESRPTILEELGRLSESKNVVILASRRAIRRYLETVSAAGADDAS